MEHGTASALDGAPHEAVMGGLRCAPGQGMPITPMTCITEWCWCYYKYILDGEVGAVTQRSDGGDLFGYLEFLAFVEAP